MIFSILMFSSVYSDVLVSVVFLFFFITDFYHCFLDVFIVDLIAFFHVTNCAAFLSYTPFLCHCTANATDVRELFLISDVFYLTLFPTFGATCF